MPKYVSQLARMLEAAGLDPDKMLDAYADPVKAYKLFRMKDEELYPLFVNADKPVLMDEWLPAEAGELTSGGKVKSKIGDLAYRPGWHAGEYPLATHIGGKATERGKIPTKPNYRPDDQVWAEIEMPNMVNWQQVANDRMQYSKAGKPIPRTAHITDQVPYGGHYRYKTNPNMTGDWLIGGDMKVNRILDDAEVRELNRGAGVEDLPRLRNLQKRKGYVPAAAAGAVGLGALGESEESEAMPLYRAFRGEHGALAGAADKMQTRLGALSFGDAKTANHYAMNPNVATDVPAQPRVFPSNVRIDNPVINNPGDPFLPFSDLEKAVGFDHAKKVFGDLEGLNDSEYIDEILEEYGVDSITDLPDDVLRELDVPAFEVFNDPETVQLMKNSGYDGGITAGYGDNYDQVEFRPFDESQVSPAFGEHPANALGAEGAWREPPTVIPDSGKYAAGAAGLGTLAEAQAYDYGTGAPGAPYRDPDAWMYERPALMEGALGGLPESVQAGILAAGKETDKLVTGARDMFGDLLGIDDEWRGENQRRQKANDRVFEPVEDEYTAATMIGSMAPYLATGALYGTLGPAGAGLTAAGEGALYYQEDPEDRLVNAALGGGLGFGVGKGLQKWGDRVSQNPWRRGR